MTESPIAHAILDEMQRLASRFERVETRLESVDNRLEALGNRFEALDTRVASLDNRYARLESRMVGLESRMTNIETVVAELDTRIRSWPDMHFLADARISIGEIFQATATDPEIKSLRADVARFREQSLDADVRLSAIEGRLGIASPVEPG